jgi:spore germination cell wall hydrolase CwlJ-like protein
VAVGDSFAIKALSELPRLRTRELGCVALLLLSASCVPLRASPAPEADPQLIEAPETAAVVQPEPMVLRDVAPTEALAINASIPIAAGENPAAASTPFSSATGIDRLRSLECLAEAVYYEARSESEEGQRAVAQVVLNRVRHVSYPGSVCGVVYQGPMRAGGGCQFTFTCDGSLARAPYGDDWLRARRIAAEALAGAVHAPVGLATHYHTHQVLPVWAMKLAKVRVIGNHNFYRIPGAGGQPLAFARRYSGREPSPLTIMATRLPVNLGRRGPAPATTAAAPLPFDLTAFAAAPATALPSPGARAAPAAAPVNDRLPESTVKAEFANSGRWLEEPAAR